jgi:hypothetical protein
MTADTQTGYWGHFTINEINGLAASPTNRGLTSDTRGLTTDIPRLT